MTRGVEDHVKFVAVALNTALEIVPRKGESALLERREAKFSSDATQCRFTRLKRIEELLKFVTQV